MKEDNVNDIYNEDEIETILKRYGEESADNVSDDFTDKSEDVPQKTVMSKADVIKHQQEQSRKKKNDDIVRRKKIAKRKNIILDIMLVFFILVFVGSASYLGIYFYRIHKAESAFSEIKKMVKEEKRSKSPDGEEVQGEDYLKYEEIDGVSVQTKFADIYKKNHDFIGWLMIPDTQVDYPVMHTPEDEEFYLKMDFDKNYSASGTLFAAAASDPLLPSDNVIIYGHNMKAGTMFHSLLSYEKEDFYLEHKTIYFDTLEENGEYEVIAAFRTQINEDDPAFFKYYQFIVAENAEEFDEYVSKVKSMTPYEISETAEYGDKLITLSTCAYHANEGRYVVVAKKVN